MTTALDTIRYNSGIAGEEVADMVDALEAKIAWFEKNEELRRTNGTIVEAYLRAENENLKEVIALSEDHRLMDEYIKLENDHKRQAARIKFLENELADALDVKALTGPTALSSVIQQRDEQAARIKELEADAARYRWLRDNKAQNNTHCWHFQNGPIIPGLLTLDTAIDAALKAASILDSSFPHSP